MKGRVQWNSICDREDFASSGDRTRSARPAGQRPTNWATGVPPTTEAKFVATIINSTVIIIGRQRGQCDIYIFFSRVEREGYLWRSSLVHKIDILLELRAPNEQINSLCLNIYTRHQLYAIF